MSIYYNEIKNISRSAGRSAVAAAAYRSGTNLYRTETDTHHNYLHKREVVFADIITPPVPSAETISAEYETDDLVEINNVRNQFRENMERYHDREYLWNEVEWIESKSEARLAREFRIAIPRELSREEQIAVTREYGQFLASEGMIVDIAIHDKNDGNPHAHIMATTRPLNMDGTWRSCKEIKRTRVLIADDGKPLVDESHPFFWRHKTDEKQYGIRIPQWDGGRMKDFCNWYEDKYCEPFYESSLALVTPVKYQDREEYEEIQNRLLACQKTRVRKGKGTERLWQRETVLDNEFNRQVNVERWREQWAVTCNKELSKYGLPLIDHRSYERQGVETIPQIHEGYTARKIEADGGTSERCEYNRRVRSANAKIRNLSDSIIQTSHEIKEVIIAKIRELIKRADTALNQRAREEVRAAGIKPLIELAKLHGSVAADNKRTRAAFERISNGKPGNEAKDRSSEQYEQAIEFRKRAAKPRKRAAEPRERDAVGREQSISRSDRYIDEYKAKWESEHMRRIQRIRDRIFDRIRKEGFMGRLYESKRNTSIETPEQNMVFNEVPIPAEELPAYRDEPEREYSHGRCR